MELGVMILGIVQNYLHPSSSMATDSSEVAHKKEESLGIKLLGTMEHELAIPQTYGSKVTNALACWVMINHWLFHFVRNPHAAARPM